MRRHRLVPALVVGLLLGSLTAACSAQDEGSPRLAMSWHAVDLPVPPGPAGRLAVRDAGRCGGRWYVVGGVYVTEEDSRPAAWSSPDLRTWSLVPLAPREYWAQRAVLSSVGCRDGKVAMVGAKDGGAHGNPRVSTWYQRPDGVLVDVDAAFELYGGPQAVSVGKVAGGPDGWLIAGNRTSGAAVWTSPDATEFTLDDHDPQLSKDSSFDTTALDQVHDGKAWTVVGSATTPGRVPRVPMAWTSPDARSWEREEVPATQEFDDLERVVTLDGGLVAVGIRGQTFATWVRRDGVWHLGGRFGSIDPNGRAAPFVSSLSTSGEYVYAATSDSTRYRMWFGRGARNWLPVPTPTRPTTAGEHAMRVVADGSSVVLLADDGRAGRVWIADGPPRRID